MTTPSTPPGEQREDESRLEFHTRRADELREQARALHTENQNAHRDTIVGFKIVRLLEEAVIHGQLATVAAINSLSQNLTVCVTDMRDHSR